MACVKIETVNILYSGTIFHSQIIIHRDDHNDDDVEHNVPLVARVRVPDVGQHCVAMSGPALVYAQN